MTKKCKVCKKEFSIQLYRKNTAKYCSRKCKSLSMKENKPWNKGKKLHYKVWNKGKIGAQQHSEETKKKISKMLKGMKHPSVTNKWRKGKPRYDMRGKNHPFWKGGVSKKNKTERQLAMETIEYKLWREAVFTRDGYKCIKCLKTGKILQADHIKPWSVYPELRYAIDNGQTLCRHCHKEKTAADSIMHFNYQHIQL